MTTEDISRFLFQPRKRYSGVRMQQGRVLLDSDWNENERIDSEEARRTLLDIVCAKGSSNQGFLVLEPIDAPAAVTLPDQTSVQSYNFSWANGSFYLGGFRFETETEENEPERFLQQQDWLQIDASASNLPLLPSLTGTQVRHDLVYLRGWEQCVTAVEDSELRERALGGPDSSIRNRLTRRVEVLTDVQGSCAEAFSTLQQVLSAPIAPDTGSPHRFDASSCELHSKARLTVAPDPNGITDDPCKPAVASGYLGADNQTIRVQLTATDRFIWGYDNASPLYRVQVTNIPGVPNGEGRKIKFLTLPRDQMAHPLAGQAVEIIPWGSILPNQEKVAEFQGQLFTLATSYDPEDNSLTLAQSVPQTWLDWLSSHSQSGSDRDSSDKRQYLYLRLWTGGSGDASLPDRNFTPGTPVPLTGTGLSVTFSEYGLPGDFWVIAARPNTPDIVVPWDLLDRALPTGPRFFFAPLALIRWSLDATGELQASVQDCRETFQPLCQSRGCCTVTVGDGRTSRGDFDSIEAAIQYLPNSGGKICLLPGLHEANVRIQARRNIEIEGCGKQTYVIPRKGDRTSPIFRMIDSDCITLLRMNLISLGGTAIVLEGTEIGTLKAIEIGHSRIIAFQAAIQVKRGLDLHIHDNKIRILDKAGAGVAIYLAAEDSLIERNDIGVIPAEKTPPPDNPDGEEPPDPIDPCADIEIIYTNILTFVAYINLIWTIPLPFFPTKPFQALGGIQIAGGSERIKVWENTIIGGAGNGIALGTSIAAFLDELEEGPEEGEEERQIELPFSIQGGQVLLGETGLAGITVQFRQIGSSLIILRKTGTDGFFTEGLDAGSYQVEILDPGYKIVRLRYIPIDNNEFNTLQINVVQEDIDLGDLLAFIYEVQIDRNEISRMGLSGIGLPRVEVPDSLPQTAITRLVLVFARLLAILGNPIIGLEIRENHIFNCFQTPLNEVLRNEIRNRGLGGISLGLCANLTIDCNRIETNGTSYITPVCGIFIFYAEQVEIHHNCIYDNGPLTNATDPLDLGKRGGIVLGASSFPLLSRLTTVLKDNQSVTDISVLLGRAAAQVHNNQVNQPAGRALTILALGPLSIANNHFNSERSGPEILETLVGAVLIINVGGLNRPGTPGIGGTIAATGAIAGTTLGAANLATFPRNASAEFLFPSGNTLFNSNQTRSGNPNESLSSQLIFSVDDIGFDGNQSDHLGGLRLSDTVIIAVNTVLWATTLRANGSRFKEILDFGQRSSLRFSLLTLSTLMNNTTNNQGDHCILANGVNALNPIASGPLVTNGNQVLDTRLCPNFFSTSQN
jgi:hypothetical protein